MVGRASTASRAESKLTLDERCPVPFRPRKKKNRQAKYHRCSRCGSQVRKRTVRVQALRGASGEVNRGVPV